MLSLDSDTTKETTMTGKKKANRLAKAVLTALVMLAGAGLMVSSFGCPGQSATQNAGTQSTQPSTEEVLQP